MTVYIYIHTHYNFVLETLQLYIKGHHQVVYRT